MMNCCACIFVMWSRTSCALTQWLFFLYCVKVVYQGQDAVAADVRRRGSIRVAMRCEVEEKMESRMRLLLIWLAWSGSVAVQKKLQDHVADSGGRWGSSETQSDRNSFIKLSSFSMQCGFNAELILRFPSVRIHINRSFVS